MMIDAPRTPRLAVGEGLPPSSRATLESLQLTEAFMADTHLPCVGSRSVWGSAVATDTNHIMHPLGHGWHLDRRAFDARLVAVACEAGARLERARFLHAHARGGSWRIETTRGEVRAGSVIDATGRSARFSRAQGAQRVQDHRLVAVAARFSEGTDTDDLTRVEARPDGWWYTARIPGGRRMVMFFTDADLLDTAFLRTTAGFTASARDVTQIDAVLRRGYVMEGRPHMRAADTSRLDRVCGDGWCAAGDAAVAFDPLSSQGIVTAMHLGERAARRALGDTSSYDEEVTRIYTRHVETRDAFYALEQRWPSRPFWRRRHTAATSR